MSGSSEAFNVKQALVLGTALPETMLWRNNTGMAYQGARVHAAPGSMLRVDAGMVILRDARAVRFGLNGSGDILGVRQGLAIAGEGKTLTGSQREDQLRFQRAWERAGGRYILFRSPEEFVEGLRRGA